MARKLLGQLLFFAAFAFSVACTRKVEEPSRITIKFPSASPSLKISQSVSALSTKWQLSDPSTPGDINCFAVAVEAPDFAGSGNRCANLSDVALLNPHFIAGGFAAGSTQTLEVPSGNNRKIYLIGFQTDDLNKCVPYLNTAAGLDNNHFSAPFVLTNTVVDLSPGDMNVYLNVPSALDASTMKFEDCAPLAFHRDATSPSPAPAPAPGPSPNPDVTFAAASQTPAESAASVSVTVTLNFPSPSPVSVPYTVSGTATGGNVDHDLAAGTVSFTPGDTSENITFNVIDDAAVEGAETVIISFGSPTNANLGATTTHTVTIAENDFPAANLTSVPTGTSNLTTLAIDVGGSDVNDYRYDVVAGNDCTSAAYGAYYAETINITDDISGLPDGDITVCVLGRSIGGVDQVTESLATWTKDTSAPTASLTGTPAPVGNVTTLNVDVSGTDVTHYRYKISGSNDCSSASGYGSEHVETTNITDGLGEGAYYLCVVARDGAGNYQAYASATFVSFDIDTTAPAAVTIDGAAGGPDVSYDSVLIDNLIVTAGWTDLADESEYRVSILENDNTTVKCSEVSKAASVTTHTFAACNLTVMENYYIRIYALDAAGNASTPATSMFTVNILPQLTPAYNAAGNYWTSYVKNDGPNKYEATDTACMGNEAGFNACLHVGEMRKVTLPTFNSCTNITADDSLNAFDWECRMVGGTPFLFSKLKPGKGLRDLVSASTWYTNDVTVYLSASPIATTSTFEWWDDDIQTLPPSGPTTATTLAPGSPTVYVVPGNMGVHGYYINADNVSIVTLGASILAWDNGAADSCNALMGDLTATLNARCMIFGKNRSYLWIEARLDGEGGTNDAESGLIFFNSAFLSVHRTTVHNMTGVEKGVYFNGVISSTVRDLEVNGAGRVLYLDSSSHNLFWNYRLARGTQASTNILELANNSDNNIFIDGQITNHNLGNGVHLSVAHDNVFQQLRVSNIGGSSGYGNLIKLSGSQVSGNKFTSILGSNCGDAAVHLANMTTAAANNMFSHMTLANCLNNSVYITNSKDSFFLNTVALNSPKNFQILGAANSTGNRFVNLASSAAPTYHFEIATSTNVQIDGWFLTDTAVCAATGTGVNSACDASGISTFTRIASGAPTFGGKVSNDTVNASDASIGIINGPITAATDLFNFFNPFRVMGMQNAAAFPASTHRNADVDGPIQIYDLSLQSIDSSYLERIGDGTNTNAIFTAGNCPDTVESDVDYLTVFGETFLTSATEIVDEHGDNDGLCESNEHCLYAPNFGYYQGSGNWQGNTCVYQNGSIGVGVDGVIMYALPTNGEPPP